MTVAEAARRVLGKIPAHQSQAIVAPGTAIFRGLRMQLTLLHTGVLAVVLAACGLVLYVSFQGLLLRPVQSVVASQAQFTVGAWQQGFSPASCGLPQNVEQRRFRSPGGPGRGNLVPIYIACFDPQGEVVARATVGPGGPGAIPDPFLRPSLIGPAARNGSAADIIESGELAGPIYRYAVAVREDGADELRGVIVAGQSIATEADALDLVRNLLLLLGGLALLASFVGGGVLANRALEPARVAFARQQTFIADASHELRTPLSLLRGDAEVLLRHRDRLPPDDAELLEDIVTETAHMEALATNLLTLARLDSGRQHLELEVVDLSDIAAVVVRRVRTVASEKGLTLNEEYRGSGLVMGDPQALEQTALILVENAVKYTPPGGAVTIQTGSDRDHAAITVSDTGIGMTPEQVERLGERFYRADTARTAGGAGLGLAIAFGIAAAHKGRLHISSQINGGTQATLVLPAIKLPEHE